MGGTFDPVHVAHLVAATEARSQLGLDHVLVVVAGDPWQKHGAVVAPADLRYEMVAAAVDGVDGIEASRLEIDRSGRTYTIDTVEELRAPDRELFLIVGGDLVDRLATWHRVDELRDLVTLAVIERAGDACAPPREWKSVPVSMPRLDISSTDLRRRLAAGEPVDFLVPAGALRVLRAHALYTAS